MVSPSKRLSVFARDGWRCVYCGFKADREEERAEMTIDHVIPRSKGGTNNKRNLVTACYPCNTKKSNRLFNAKSNGKIYRIITSPKSRPADH